MTTQEASQTQVIGNVLTALERPISMNRETKFEPDTSLAPTPSKEDTQEPNPDTKKDSHNWEKRYSDLKSFSDKKVNELTARLTDLETKLTSKEPEKLPLTEDELTSQIEENPALANFVITLLAKKNADNPTIKELKAKQDELTKVIAQTEQAKAFQEILKAHPDANEIKDSEKFSEWYSLQDEDVQKLFNSTRISTVIDAISYYKAQNGLLNTPVQKRNKAKEDATEVSPNTNAKPMAKEGRIWKASEISKMRTGEFAKYEKEIEQAMYEGRFDPNS